ncbi:MAG: hypothetical protein M1470_08575 [Bacteroidetes bacterium]|nr:hypothetical protein [Bacteroidota bacterium]MCL5737963.1 hypothetical protein [Bacteroidota bacterium]
MRRLAFLLLVLCGANSIVIARTSPEAEARTDSLTSLAASAPKVFIDCSFCDLDYIRTEITFVNYVRDRKEAQVQVLVTTQNTGSGGTEYTLTLLGLQNFTGLDDTLKYISTPSETQDEIRKGLVKVLKLGFIRYVARTPVGDNISVSFNESTKPAAAVDKWNYWVFSVSGNGFLSAQKSTTFGSLYGSLSIQRITKRLKFFSSGYVNYNESDFTIGDQNIKSISRSKGWSALAAVSIDDHWSVGGFTSVSSSTYSNTKIALGLYPAIEYDVFPYSESTRKQLRILYKLGDDYYSYNEETIFNKFSENLPKQDLSIALDLTQPWGSVSLSLEGSNYFYDFSKNRVILSTQLSLRLFEGLTLNLFGSGSMIHDQLSLPLAGATPNQILLQQKELATQYRYFVSLGLSYTFGSIYNNIVNPRFGSQGGGYTIIY